MFFVEEIKYDRINDFINLVMEKWKQCYTTSISKNIFVKWLLRQKFPNVILKETDNDIGHLKYWGTKYIYHSYPRIPKRNKFITYEYGRYCIIPPIRKNKNGQTVWLINFKNVNFDIDAVGKDIDQKNIIILNHDMFGYPACNIISIEIVNDDVVLKNVYYRDTRHCNYLAMLSRKK